MMMQQTSLQQQRAFIHSDGKNLLAAFSSDLPRSFSWPW